MSCFKRQSTSLSYKKNGDEINYDVLDKGRIFGESSLYENAYRPTTVSAINDVEIITCHLQDLYPYLSSSLDLTISLLKMLNDNCNHLTQLLKWAQTYNRYEKVAAFLYDLSKDNNKEKIYFLVVFLIRIKKLLIL